MWSGEAGQTAVFITLLLMFAFIGIMALAIDGGMLYLARRGLQNRSDAACLAASVETAQNPGNSTAAIDIAVEYLNLNGASPDWYSPNQGAGVSLTKGIEVSGLEVRVALQQDVPTFFTRFLNQPPTLVGARSHCNAQAGGGLLPIAIKRYGEDPDLAASLGGNCVDGGTGVCSNPYGTAEETALGLMDDVDCTNNTPPPGYSCDPLYGLDQGNDGQGENPEPWHNVVDYAKSAGSDVLTAWPHNPAPASNLPADPACLYLPPFAPAGCVGSEATAAPTNPGRAMYIVGDGALPNVAQGSDFRFFITLDVRCITCGANRWYNTQYGVDPTTSLNTLKNMSMYWVCNGYLGSLPLPGEQVGSLSGADANQAAGEIGDCYQPGDVVAVVVYDGKVYKDPNFTIDVSPATDNQSVTWTDLNGDGNDYEPDGSPDTDPITGSPEILGPAVSCPGFGANTGILWPRCAQYTLTLTPDTHFNSTGVELTVYTSDEWYWDYPLRDEGNDFQPDDLNGDGIWDDTPIVASWNPPNADGDPLSEDPIITRISRPVSAATPIPMTFYVWQRGTTHSSMTRTIFIDAYDPNTQLHHLTTARITVAGNEATEDFAMALGDDPFLRVRKPNAGQQSETWSVDFQNVGVNPSPEQPLLYWCTDRTGENCNLDYDPTGRPTGIEVRWRRQGQDWELTIRVDNTAEIARRFFKIVPANALGTACTLAYPCSPDTPNGHFAMGSFDVIAESGSAATMNSFVVVLGYAQIEILAMDPNSVVGRIIHASADISDIPLSLVPRLIPWE